jgi:hypothetical protein
VTFGAERNAADGAETGCTKIARETIRSNNLGYTGIGDAKCGISPFREARTRRDVA